MLPVSLVQGKPCSRAPTLGQPVLRGASAKNNPALTSGIQKTGCKLPPKTARNSPQKSQTPGSSLACLSEDSSPLDGYPQSLRLAPGPLTRLCIQTHSGLHTVVTVAFSGPLRRHHTLQKNSQRSGGGWLFSSRGAIAYKKMNSHQSAGPGGGGGGGGVGVRGVACRTEPLAMK